MFNQLCLVTSRTCYGAKIQTFVDMQNNKKENLPIKVAFQYLRCRGIAHTQQDVCDAMGVSKSNISRAFNGDKKYLTQSFIIRFNDAFGKIFNENYLLTGEGNLLNASNSNAVEVPLENEGTFYTETHNGTKFYELPDGNYRMEVSLVPWCAYGRFANECGTLEPDKEEWEKESFHTDKIVHGRYLAFEVRGDSMDDGTRASFEEGDIVLVRELDRIHWRDGLRFKDHPFWVVVFDNSVLIKQIIAQDLETGKITFHSLNPSPEYSDFTLGMDEIRALYYVLQKKPKTVKF